MTMSEPRKTPDIVMNMMAKIGENERISLNGLGRICEILNSNFGDIVDVYRIRRKNYEFKYECQ